MKLQLIRWLALTTVATTMLPALAAVNLPKEGNFDIMACWSATTNILPAGKDSAASYEMLGTTTSMIPGGLGDQSSFRCVGLSTTIKGRQGGGNLCEVTDPDGDKRFTSFHIQPDGSVVRELLSGTGKYEGMTLTASVSLMPPVKDAKPGTFQGCNRQTGTYKLK